ncbi:MATE family efflux transporter [Bacillus massilinigeriensis]|uniref:MATE family efflux transporter n=1 Tax=Bacillus mediterraneensis TaxID=1805474 RepID=UPI0008F95462|nr:MATE family efflux transporter [Bacillus mediterraneensis]
MKETFNQYEKTKQLLTILFPILITQLSMYAMNFFDTMMSGHYSSVDLAGVAVGSSLWVPVYTGLSGILIAVTPIVSQFIGGSKEEDVAFTVIQAAYLAVFMALVTIVVGGFAITPIVSSMSLEKEVEIVAHDYLVALGIGIFPLFLVHVLRNFMDALGKTQVTMMVMLSAFPINAFLNYVFIYGKLGLPDFGGVGAGYASAITYWILLMITIGIILRKRPFSVYRIFDKLFRISFLEWKELLVIGVPIGFAIFFETSIFAAVTLFMSGYDTVTIASHQAALNFASFLYMVPLSISMALTIVVGFEAGAKRYRDAIQYSIIGISIAVGMAILCGLGLFVFREQIAGIYSGDEKVIQLTAQFLVYALFFQLSDAIQAPVQGALRGYKDVNITFLMAFISYWIIGLPVGYLLAQMTVLGAIGFWVGLIAGLAVGATTLLIRLLFIQKKKLGEHHSI